MDIMYQDLNNFSFCKPKVPDYSKVKDKPIIKRQVHMSDSIVISQFTFKL